MSSIQGIQGTSSLWDNTQTSSGSSAASQLSETVSQMASGGGSGSSSGDEETVTIQRTQPDGSILILTMQDDQVISTTKIRAPQRQMKDPLMTEGPMANQAQSARTAMMDHFNDTSASITTGALFTQGV